MQGGTARITRTAVALAIGAILGAAPAAEAGGFRLYRHRSGYLHGASHPCAIRAPRYDGYYYGGAGFGIGGGGYDPYVEYAQRDFDTRRDRLLDRAAEVDVSYLHTATAMPAPARTQPLEAGWDFLRRDEAVKALGRFTARIMVAPGDAQARVGFALAAALLDDDGAAAQSMRTAVRFDPEVLNEFASDEVLDTLIRRLLDDLDPEEGAPSADARFLVASMHGLLREPEAGLTALEDIAADDRDASTEALCRMLGAPAAAPALASNTVEP